jgi:hypothetical protein
VTDEHSVAQQAERSGESLATSVDSEALAANVSEHTNHCELQHLDTQLPCYCPYVLSEPSWGDFVWAVENLPSRLLPEAVKHLMAEQKNRAL